MMLRVRLCRCKGVGMSFAFRSLLYSKNKMLCQKVYQEARLNVNSGPNKRVFNCFQKWADFHHSIMTPSRLLWGRAIARHFGGKRVLVDPTSSPNLNGHPLKVRNHNINTLIVYSKVKSTKIFLHWKFCIHLNIFKSYHQPMQKSTVFHKQCINFRNSKYCIHMKLTVMF